MTLNRVPALPGRIAIVDPKTGYPTTQFMRWWQENIQQSVNALVSVAQAQAAADAANAAADAANEAAASVTASTDIANSYPEGVAIGATDAGGSTTVTISAHNRVYASGTSVAVNGGTITGLAYSTSYWIAYDQPSRSGGAVTYQAFTTSQGNGVNNPDRHFIGALTTPDAGGLDTNGAPSQPPGGVDPPEFDGGALPP